MINTTEMLTITIIFLIIILTVLVIGLYIYTSLAYVAIARKAKLRKPELAWIPWAGPIIIAFQTSKMHWWPWLLLIGLIIPIVNVLTMLTFSVFAVIWEWKMFEKIKRPGWWAILMLISPVNYILMGIAAWTEP